MTHEQETELKAALTHFDRAYQLLQREALKNPEGRREVSRGIYFLKDVLFAIMGVKNDEDD